jgi:hypothetical protein
VDRRRRRRHRNLGFRDRVGHRDFRGFGRCSRSNDLCGITGGSEHQQLPQPDDEHLGPDALPEDGWQRRGTGGGPPGPFVDIFVDFSWAGGVTDVSFTIFDLDTQPPGSFTDRMWMRGHIPGAGTAITDFLAPTDIDPLPGLPGPQTWEVDPLSNANYAVVDGVVENVGGTGDEANRAVVNVQFLGITIDFIQFRYENMDPASGIQYVSIGDITFTPIPEPNAASLLMLGLVGLAVLGRRCSASPG